MDLKHILSATVACLLLLLDFTNGAGISNSHVPKSTRHLASDAIGYSYKESSGRYSKGSNAIENCSVLINEDLVREIASYQPIADQIIEAVMNGNWKGKAYEALHDLVDKYPIRLSGFQNLEDSIDYMMEKMRAYGYENVRGEEVPVPHWVRGEESADMLEPHQKKLRLLGLGSTVGTPEEGITGDVLVVKSFADLDAKRDQAQGKIVVYNQGWLGSYPATNIYRTNGASHASQYGAVATLIQSVAPFSLDTPHTGAQVYWANVTKIPTACITMEDADFMYRLQEKGEQLRVHVKLLDYNLPVTTSRNVIGEIVGSTIQTEYVGVSGHIDSWDVGQGAMDDGGGVMVSVIALAVLKDLGLRSKRTLQTILWTSEEPGLVGVEGFAAQHLDILANYSVIFESDEGTFKPNGLDFAGSEAAGCIVNEVLKLTASINTTIYTMYPEVSSDITKLQALGVPGLQNNNDDDLYFWYHHTEADTITMMDSEELDLNTALFAVSSFVLADISAKLPRDPPSVARTVVETGC
ncbi:unnamed protein product [Orchesella dallaii]|uniref:Carboxypeptidase Q n=1 Tax=Orchesella dallaii TaxID=48710 RepID=A0ABP1PLA3_9HEXA